MATLHLKHDAELYYRLVGGHPDRPRSVNYLHERALIEWPNSSRSDE
jgi:hypothetical protein